MLDLYGIGAWEEGGGFVLAREGSSAAGARVIRDMVAVDDRPLVEFVRSPDQDLPVEAVLAFRDPFAEYQTASARHVRLGAGGQRQAEIGFPGVLEPDEAEALLADWMQRKWRQRQRASFAVAPTEVAIAPGAVLLLPSAAGARFLVDEVEEGLVKAVSAREIAGAVAARRRSVTLPPPQPMPIFGRPQVIFLDLPMVPGGEAHDQFRAALWAKPWKSQALYASPETTGFTLRATAFAPAFLGRLAAPLAASFHGRIDRTNAVLVELHSGELASVSRAQLMNGANAAAIRSAAGAWEIVQFETAEEVSPSLWRLTDLLRGQLGTDDAMRAGAAAGADFVVLDEAVKAAGLLASETGLSLTWRAGPSGQDFSAATFVQQTVTGGLRARVPLSPVHLKAKLMTSGDVAISWVRRGRIDADGWEGDDIPVGEETESYRVEAATDTGTLKRSGTVGTQAWIYPASMVAVDFPVLPAIAAITVRQISATAGPGIAAKVEFELA